MHFQISCAAELSGSAEPFRTEITFISFLAGRGNRVTMYNVYLYRVKRVLGTQENMPELLFTVVAPWSIKSNFRWSTGRRRGAFGSLKSHPERTGLQRNCARAGPGDSPTYHYSNRAF